MSGQGCRTGPVFAVFASLKRQSAGPVLAPLAACVAAPRAVPVPGGDDTAGPTEIARLAQAAGVPLRAAPDVGSALRSLAATYGAPAPLARVIVTGSLYLVRAVRAGAWGGSDAAD